MSDEDLAKKLLSTEQELDKLRKLSIKVVADYDDLKDKYDDNLIAYKNLLRCYEEQEQQLNSIPNVLENVAAEYDDIKTKYELETDLRNEAETYASKIHKENRKLKRQSQALFQKFNVVAVDIDIDGIGDILEEDSEDSDGGTKKQVEHLNDIVKGLEEQIASLHGDVQRAFTDKEVAEQVAEEAKKKYEEERKANEKNHYSLEYYQKTLKQLERASVLLVQDYDQLYNQMEQQKTLQVKAEEYASRMVQDREAMKRQSSALLASAATDDRLMKAMQDIEDLTKLLEAEKHARQTEVDDLKSQIDTTFEEEKIASLEDQLKLSTMEVGILEKRIEDAEKEIQKLEKENRDLDEKLKNPPPPPPPPPPPVKSILPSLSAALNRKKKKATKDRVLKDALGSQNQAMSDAMGEMMERIKKGNALRKRVSTGNKPLEIAKKEGTAIGEMHGILTTLKSNRSLTRSRSGSGHSNPSADGADNQLLKILNSRRKITDVQPESKENQPGAPNLTVSAIASQKNRDSKPLPSPRKSVRKLTNIEEKRESVSAEAMYEEVKGH